MFVIFGTRQRITDDPNGTPSRLRCRSCGTIAAFRPRVARRFFHIFWIPLIPLGKPHPIMECPNCKTRYERV